MYSMNFDITIGKYRLAALEKVAIKCSVENLADTADILSLIHISEPTRPY